jgi:hypothetical protein
MCTTPAASSSVSETPSPCHPVAGTRELMETLVAALLAPTGDPPQVLNAGWLTRDFPNVAFELPYRMMTPRQGARRRGHARADRAPDPGSFHALSVPSGRREEATNLLVPVAVSASHVVFGAIRLGMPVGHDGIALSGSHDAHFSSIAAGWWVHV